MKRDDMSKQDRCPHCGAELMQGTPKTHYKCGWPIKPFKYVDPQLFHEMRKILKG